MFGAGWTGGSVPSALVRGIPQETTRQLDRRYRFGFGGVLAGSIN